MRVQVLIAIAALTGASVAVACGNGSSDDSTPLVATPDTATPGAAPTQARKTKLELAPIDDAEIIIRESAPPQYAVRIVSGLPSGCHEIASADVSRSGTEITVTVQNRLPDDPTIACTAIYGTHEDTLELGTDFTAGTMYTVKVNDKTLEFTAH